MLGYVPLTAVSSKPGFRTPAGGARTIVINGRHPKPYKLSNMRKKLTEMLQGTLLSRYNSISSGERAMLEDFKKFAMRGNVIDLAVGVIIGAAFGSIW